MTEKLIGFPEFQTGRIVPVGVTLQADGSYSINFNGTIAALEIGVVEGEGIAGTPSGGVITVQGDPAGTPVPVSGNVGRSAQTVTPAAQPTTNSYADVTGSTLDTLNNASVSYTLVNTDPANSLDWKVLGANAVDFSDAQTVQAQATVVALGVTSYSASVAVWRYYKVQVKSTVALTPATAAVHGVAKG